MATTRVLLDTGPAWAHGGPLSPPPPPAATPPPKVVKVIPRQFDANRLVAPKVIPKEIAMIKEDDMPPPSAGVVGGVDHRDRE